MKKTEVQRVLEMEGELGSERERERKRKQERKRER